MKTQNLRKLVFLCTGLLLFSCSKNDLSETDETLVSEKTEVEIVDNAAAKAVIAIGWPAGVYGNANINAYEDEVYSVIIPQAEQNAVASHLRRFKVRFQVRKNGKWKHKQTYNDKPSTVTAKFPTFGNGNTAKWRIGFQMYNKNTGATYSRQWKTITVNN
ncbi:hypothetical protein [Aquimarina aquimarini]|uniref:hypothetical protein n=1 Tax=Aquimarina aquimarini TaxID=1191734 RepID=UPI000D54B2D8|nr:hypothetical protein [Aquimarina aquimarini]